MKKMMIALIAMLTIAVSASAMSYEQARREALFLTDKMAYELNLTDAQYEAAYEINLDYLMGVTSRYDVFGPYWERRNLDLSYILFSWQWDMFRAATFFYRPLYWNAGYWHFGIYARYPHRDYFYFGRPHFYASYRGGHSWRMNGGRSWYEHRRDFYRPAGRTHDNHRGMRNGYDRGDYRGGRVAGGSSTRHNQGLQDQNRGSLDRTVTAATATTTTRVTPAKTTAATARARWAAADRTTEHAPAAHSKAAVWTMACATTTATSEAHAARRRPAAPSAARTQRPPGRHR